MIVDVIYGMLGAGKTTCIRNVLESSAPGAGWVVLVNEFGNVGIDGRTLAGSGSAAATIVELPSGCICCTLASDFRQQLIDVSAQYAPDRLLIEPTGMATIGQLMAILAQDEIQRLYTALRLIHIVDGTEFLSLFKANRRFVENQIRASQVVLLNKSDLLSPSRVELLAESIREIHPEAHVYPTSFARLAPDVLAELFEQGRTEPGLLPEAEMDGDEGKHYESFGRRYAAQVFESERLDVFFRRLQAHEYGAVVRAKGIFRTEHAWIALELAAGTVQRAPGSAGAESLISIIGQELDAAVLDAHLQQCMLGQ